MNDPREEKSVPSRLFFIDVNVTLTKKVSVLTDNYELVKDIDGHVYENLDNTDWETEYKESHYKINELLDMLKVYARNEIIHLPKGSVREIELRHIISDCEGWSVESESYEEG